MKPDRIVAEDIPFTKNVDTLKTLSRMNGIFIFNAYAYNHGEATIYGPTQWRSMIGLAGDAYKADTQIFIIEKFKLAEERLIDRHKEARKEIRNDYEKIKGEEKVKRERYNKIKNRKKLDENETAELKELKKVVPVLKKELKKLKDDVKKKSKTLSINIYSETGINEDIADSIGVGLAYVGEHG